ncbi:MAG: 6-phosphogluconolactonase [Ardenticatenia bacterium]|nr:6-phosphogluconolactonase [Ardenticatenia bacterium]
MGTVALHVYDSPKAFVRAAAELFVDRAERAIRERGRFSVALAGGSTPRPLYEMLATPPWSGAVDWGRVHFFWGDERPVPPDHPASNYRMVAETLLAELPINAEHVHRVEAERPPEEAALAYELDLRRHFGLAVGEWPRFDLILLGLGGDGHTASLFPHTEVLWEHRRLVAAPFISKLGTHRITMTVPTINHARVILFLVMGQAKAEAVARACRGHYAPDECPAQLIHPRDGELHWVVDKEAAGAL